MSNFISHTVKQKRKEISKLYFCCTICRKCNKIEDKGPFFPSKALYDYINSKYFRCSLHAK